MPDTLSDIFSFSIKDQFLDLIRRQISITGFKPVSILFNPVTETEAPGRMFDLERNNTEIAFGEIERNSFSITQRMPVEFIVENIPLFLVEVVDKIGDKGIPFGIVNVQRRFTGPVTQVPKINQARKTGDMILMAVGEEDISDAVNSLFEVMDDTFAAIQQETRRSKVKPRRIERL